MSVNVSGSIDRSCRTFAELIARRALIHPDRPALTFVRDDETQVELSYGQLYDAASCIAAQLSPLGEPGSRGLLFFPPGAEFLKGFLGCLLAGWVPVPTCFPKAGRSIPRLESIANHCGPSALLTESATMQMVNRDKWNGCAATLPVLLTDQETTASTCDFSFQPLSAHANEQPLALLQYTSGSTSDPKGVMVTQDNLLANLEAIRVGFSIPFCDGTSSNVESSVFWLPAFHDMGLIGGLLSPLYIGAHTVNFSPRAFLTRPLKWLKLISQHRATITGGPNFAYQLCVDRIDGAQAEELDLSSLRVAFCGAEPVCARTMEQFTSRFAHTGLSRRTLTPCYGLAESTLFVSGGRTRDVVELTVSRTALSSNRVKVLPNGTVDDAQRLVSCGPVATTAEVQIVDPQSLTVQPPMQIGELWLRGPSVAQGYWRDSEAADAAELQSKFHAVLAGANETGPRYCRSGDLGFIYQNELYVTGRLKDLIILRGRNHYPQDIESTVRSAIDGITALDAAAARSESHQVSGLAVAFSVQGPVSEGLCVVVETPRHFDEASFPMCVRQIRRSVIDEHEVDPRHVLLVRPGGIPITTSGKVQRTATRQAFESNNLQTRYRWDRTDVRTDGAPLPPPVLPETIDAGQQATIAHGIEQWLLSWLMVRGGVAGHELDANKAFNDFGLDSLSAIEMSGEIEDWLGVRLTPLTAFEHPTPRDLANFLANELTT
jgi:acyl-CoA synthetase (AMP-forming)/AMP-acid ligase II/acyl carrier protein